MENSKKNKQKGRPKKNDSKGTAFQENLNKLFRKSGERQDAVAKVFGVSRQSFGNWLQGRNQPDYETLIAIANYYNVSTDYLLGRTENPTIDEDVQQTNAGLSKEQLMLLLGMVYEIGESSEHFVDFDYSTKTYNDLWVYGTYVSIYIHERDPVTGRSKQVCDSMDVSTVNELVMNWLTSWKTRIEQEREQNEMV